MGNGFSGVYRKLKKTIKEGVLLKNEPLKNHCSFKIGGKAKILVAPNDLEEFIKTMDILKDSKLPYFVLGNGTNVLFSDEGLDGVVLKMTQFNDIYGEDNVLVVGAGMSMSALSVYAQQKGLSGLEGAFGLPGTVAGAVVMNASCFDFVTTDVVTSVLAFVNGKITELKNSDCDFGYRTSRFRREGIIILRVEFTLKSGQSDVIQEKMSEMMSRRRKTQPSLPSAGSVFKNLSDKKVAKLIDDAGFKGYTIGGAKVSEVHANFIVNNGNATAEDVRTIICDINKHFSEENVQLETEIIQIDKMGEEYDFIR